MCIYLVHLFIISISLVIQKIVRTNTILTIRKQKNLKRGRRQEVIGDLPQQKRIFTTTTTENMKRKTTDYTNCNHLFDDTEKNDGMTKKRSSSRKALRKTIMDAKKTASETETNKMRDVVANTDRSSSTEDQKNVHKIDSVLKYN